jgi:general secretion pathway protein G
VERSSESLSRLQRSFDFARDDIIIQITEMRIFKTNNKKQKGFTLMELIVAMAILAILTTGGLTTYTRSLKRGRDAQRKSDLSQIQKALELYFNDKSSYPLDNGSGQIGSDACQGSTCVWGTSAFEDSTGTVYMKLLPQDPIESQSYFYRADTDGLWYQLYAKLENNDDPQAQSFADPPKCGTNDCNYGVTSSNTIP